eukprot:TRINITY_DN9268_c0_g1_i1.p1 TRINITY_DN9268_c0_g1~~TRINITY_DN9268_c0_g1_i1.p1  ORF type:complete len:150 (-),score=27.50 TRINITY_DN9268_c0_g1_i1:14-463(-)
MMHMWTYKDLEFTSDLDVQKQISVGLFDAKGVRPTHLKEYENEVNGGMPFNHMETRLVGIHSMRFSPLNCQIALIPGELHSFFCLARFEGRSFLTYHIIADSQEQSNKLNKCIEDNQTLHQLMKAMSLIDQEFHQEMQKVAIFVGIKMD